MMCLNGNVIPRVSEVLHLGQVIRDNVIKLMLQKFFVEFSQKMNIFLASSLSVIGVASMIIDACCMEGIPFSSNYICFLKLFYQ